MNFGLNNNSSLLISEQKQPTVDLSLARANFAGKEILAVAEVVAKTPLLHLVVALLPQTRKITEARGVVVAMEILHP